jgi:hypothetical protein
VIVLEKSQARRIIEVLGQSGTPPSHGVSYYNVGNASLLNALNDHYLKDYLPEGGATFKLVVGGYGSGKSHFLYCIRDLAWARGFAVSKVDLSPKECPYNDQKRVYGAVASAVTWSDAEGQEGDDPGLVRLIEGTMRRLLAADGLDARTPDAEYHPTIEGLIDSLQNNVIDSPSYRNAIIGYCRAIIRGDDGREESLMRWLHGEEITPFDMRELRAVGVTEKITKTNAFRMLRSLCQVVRALQYNGLALLFDEGDRMTSIGGKPEKEATDNLREIIDRCREDLPGALFVYAVPPVFINEVIPKYPALQQRVAAPGYFSRSNPFSPQINLEKQLDLQGVAFLTEVGARLMPIFRTAYPDTSLSNDVQTSNIEILAQAANDSVLDVSSRRLFVKTLVTLWHDQAVNGEVLITEEQATELIRGGHDSLNALHDTQQRPY